jgi:spore germination protein YaaH
MKSHFIIFLFTALVLIQSANADQRIKSWGYILHSSNLTDNYLEAVIPAYSVISITGFSLAADGGLKTEPAILIKRTIALTKKHSVKLYPLISFTSADGGRRLLNSKSARARAIQSIAGLTRDDNVAGIHLDFEYLPPGDSKKLGHFLSELKALPFKGSITMAIFPPVEFPEKWSRFHDLAIIGAYADEIVLMGYDLHSMQTGPGPVTDPVWVEKNIRAVLQHIRAERIWLGIPAYGYRWCGGKAVALSAKQAVKLARLYQAKRDLSQNIYFSYAVAAQPCQVFASDSQTRAALARLAGTYGLAGTAMWRLGLED